MFGRDSAAASKQQEAKQEQREQQAGERRSEVRTRGDPGAGPGRRRVVLGVVHVGDVRV